VSERVKFNDVRHLVRAAVIVVVVVVGFLIARSLTVPKSFGQYGHYRGDSVVEKMGLPVIVQGSESCRECHGEAIKRKGKPSLWLGYKAWKEGGHASNTCENCHSNCKEHSELRRAEKEKGIKLEKDVITSEKAREHCFMCHAALAARPKGSKLYDAEAHAGYCQAMELKKDAACSECHVPHAPDTLVEPPE